MLTYCFKCKEKTVNVNDNVVTSGNRSYNKSQCKDCGGKKSQIVKSQKGGDDIDVALNQESYKGKDERKDNVAGYTYDKDLSTKKTLVYNNGKDTRVVHRGTDPKNIGDLASDALLSFGLLNKYTSKRIRNAEDVTKKAKEKYNTNTVSHTGHSLGGTVGATIQKKDEKGEYYNPGTTPLSLLSTKKNKNTTNYTTGVDPISVSTLLGRNKTKLVKPTKLNVHSLDNFKGV